MADRPDPSSGEADHASHDPERIAALLDRDLPVDDRVAAERLIERCAACAALHADLVALSTATRALPTARRPRDFLITPEIAATYRRDHSVGEPVPPGARLIGEMTDTRSTHALHDRLLIANLLDRRPEPTERARAERQMAACGECARLFDDLVLLSEATKAMPVPTRSRDFTLTPADADRLRVRGWRRVLAAIGSGRDTFTRPLAIGLTTLGLASLLVGTVPGSLFGSGQATGETAEDSARNAAGAADSAPGAEAFTQGPAAPSAAAASGPVVAAAAPTDTPTEEPPAGVLPAPTVGPDVLFEGGEQSPIAGEPQDRGAVDQYSQRLTVGGGGPSPFVLAAAALLLMGLGLFGLRWTARRLGDG